MALYGVRGGFVQGSELTFVVKRRMILEMTTKKKHQTPEAPAMSSAIALFRPSFEAVMVNTWTFLCLLLLPITLFIFSP